MNAQVMFVIQIIADLLFCLVVVLLLARLKRSLNRNKTTIVDKERLANLEELISRSQRDSEVFLHKLDESLQKFQQTATKIEAGEGRLKTLLKEIDEKARLLEEDNPAGASYSGRSGDHYQRVVDFLQSGLSIDEIARQTDIPAAEIALISNLEKRKKPG